ncbi:motility associated factor glycosyltransferase family protein [Orenia marismortui]|uniref:DUF115 domain-containing protein n=1 Tax=Orenia marismortui TaxID=46469 RepID=A0A4R8HFW5_9FIRM|nr:6-hydroxymethylpterin diphosphokinase MptE-like protein [Orenia marismortui]TDX58912.1 hypothetical protein C7959_10250 [Orenia marismortui]
MLRRNINALKKRYPDLLKKLEKMDTEGLIYDLVEAKNNSKTIKIRSENRSVFIHSKYNPQREASKFIDNIEVEEFNSIILLGSGLGYHVLELFNKIRNTEKKLFIVEKNLSLFKEALKCNNFSQLLNSPKCHFFIGESLEDGGTKLYEFIINNLDNQNFEDISAIKWNALTACDKGYYKLAIKQIHQVFTQLKSNKIMLLHAGKVWNQNLLTNFKEIIRTPGISHIRDLFKDKAIIIVAAGPSLNKNIDDLKAAKGKSLIICVDIVMNTLLAEGIIPDIVIIADQSEFHIKYFKEVDQSKLKNTILAFNPRVQPQVVQEWKGPKLLTPSVSENFIIKWIERYTGQKGRVFEGGSVSHAAFGLAYFLGGDPIVFVGQDLAFSDQKSTHATGSELEEDFKTHMKHSQRDFMQVEDINGDLVWTRDDYYSFLQWFNKNIRVLKESGYRGKIIDATEGGAYIQGTEVVTLKEAVDRYGLDINKSKEQLLEKIKGYQVRRENELILALKNSINNLEKIKKQAQSGIELVDQLLEDTNNTEEKIEKLKSINQKIGTFAADMVFFEAEFYDMMSSGLDNNFIQNLFTKNHSSEDLNRLIEYYNRLISGSQKAFKGLKDVID